MLTPAILEAISIANLPDIEWQHGDDLCDCTFQRIGMHKNPYLAETLEIRLCCIWAELGKQYPQFFRQFPGYLDDNTGEWITDPWEWNGETDMPTALWHRQLAKTENVSLSEAREMRLPAPKGKPRMPKPVLLLKWGNEWIPVELG
jgi:hypothetical protein